MSPEVCLASRRLFSGRVVGLRVDRVRLPGGGETEREVVEHRGAAAVVPLTERGEVLLVRQYRYAVGEFLLEIPAGTLEPGEAPLACAVRELAEEVGVQARRWDPLAVLYPSPGVLTEAMHLFLATGLVAAPGRAAADEDLAVERLPLGEAVARVERGEIRDAKSVAGLLLAARHRGA
ncbi:MAG: NUDIX hydrolase [Armatimonadota bacterium]|nr:NUDIX hydrolase [Armatimonadota bacterium]MDR7427128.1 NUDIX hydrolase [Armatimonadota bacterium]MDR7464209.1 NUDIX hydrolase [Armatimonadota bacterium]MDR7470002.1 NUDIX hydrolase [Armatimonadota bacterium]MDR7474104.1 NUDIX hydrolase [Armatimonadota bacterium]